MLCADTEGRCRLRSSVTDTLVVTPTNRSTLGDRAVFGGSVADLERSASVSENCNVLDHIPAATEDRLLSTVFLLNLIILEHHHF